MSSRRRGRTHATRQRLAAAAPGELSAAQASQARQRETRLSDPHGQVLTGRDISDVTIGRPERQPAGVSVSLRRVGESARRRVGASARRARTDTGPRLKTRPLSSGLQLR